MSFDITPNSNLNNYMNKIGYLVHDNPHDVKSFSGTGFYMFNALCKNKNAAVHLLGEKYLKKQSIINQVSKVLRKLFCFSSKLREKVDLIEQYFFLEAIKKELKENTFDFIVAPVCSHLIAEIAKHPKIPAILFITDATPSFLKDFYQWDIPDNAFVTEKTAIKNATYVIYSSDYMRRLASTEYSECDKEKFLTIPFGLNMNAVPDTIPTKTYTDKLNLLFVGRDWERKGGEKVLSALQILVNWGYDVQLTIIGANPEQARNVCNIRIIEYVNKSSESDQAMYFEILSKAHFLLLPTKADCTPMVIAEANAFGVPAITTNVGGIATLVKEGKNGFLLNIDSTANEYANLVHKVFSDKKLYLDLSNSSRKEYEDRLNWTIWAERIIETGMECKKSK